MFKKTLVVFVFLALIVNNTVFSQSVAIDTALSNAAREIAESVPNGKRIAVLNISSEFETLSDYIINELIVNLVNTRAFQIVPRSTVELELANREFDFQMTGFVSDESQKNLGQFLGADTIISGSVARDSTNSYRLVLNSIDLESFTYQSTYRISITNDTQVKALIAGSGGLFYEDYTVGQRLGMSGLNIFFGTGSLINKHYSGLVVTALETLGIGVIVFGFVADGILDWAPSYVNPIKYAGIGFISVGAVVGLIIPFFHHKPDNTIISQNAFPFGLELVSSNNQDINGFRILYNMRF